MEEVVLNRFASTKNETLGDLIYRGKVVAKTLELPWKNNTNRVSCIPVGIYPVIRRRSAKYGLHFHVQNVPKRSYILIHNANYYWNLLGCIGVGETHKDINSDGDLDITNSKVTMNKLLAILPDKFYLKIV